MQKAKVTLFNGMAVGQNPVLNIAKAFWKVKTDLLVPHPSPEVLASRDCVSDAPTTALGSVPHDAGRTSGLQLVASTDEPKVSF